MIHYNPEFKNLIKLLCSAIFIFLSNYLYSSDTTINSLTYFPSGYYTFDTITVNDTLICQGNIALNTGVIISCYNMVINIGGKLSADSQGYPTGQGPGKGIGGGGGGSGGGYGGYGGEGTNGAGGGIPYGSITNPSDLGSGGNITSAFGGGLVHLIVDNQLTINGVLSANGQNGIIVGGGSGGTVFIRTKILSGSGQITSNGGNGGGSDFGSGGGGRIAIYYDTNNFTGTILATGGVANYGGDPTCGTIFMKQTNQTNGDLILDESGLTKTGYYTPLSGNYTFDTIIFKNRGQCEVVSGANIYTSNVSSDSNSCKMKLTGNLYAPNNFSFSYLTMINNGGMNIPDGNLTVNNAGIFEVMNNNLTLNNLTVKPNGMLTHTANYDGQKRYWLNLTVNNNLTIESGGTINVTGKGYPTVTGPGKPIAGDCGGSYGGRGSAAGGATPGDTYGSDTAPTDLGSGAATSGGGSLYALVWGILRIDGSILSEGSPSGTGAGSGGSIYIKAPNFTGGASGIISVKGGNSTGNWTGGGGGRMAVYYYANNYTGTFDTSPGFTGGGVPTPAQPGTRYVVQTNFHLPPRIPSIDNPAYSSPIPGKRPSFKWTAPTDEENDTLQFDIEVSQDSMFTSTPTISASSDISTAGFEYSLDNGITWTSYSASGIWLVLTPSFKVRYTVQQDLWIGDWYWRVRAKDIDGNGSWSDTGYLPSIIGDLVVRITYPEDSIAVYADKIKVEGTIEQSITQSISINGTSRNLELTDNKFSLEVNLEMSKNTVGVTGNGVLGNYISDTVVIYRLRVPMSLNEAVIGNKGGVVRLDDYDGDEDNDAKVEIGEGVFEKEISVKFTRLKSDINPMYEITINNLESYKLKKRIKITLSYKSISVESSDEDKLRIFNWDGVKWNPVGSEVNKSKKTISCYTDHTSRYAVMVLPTVKDVVVNASPPIFTPNKDGINDFVVFNVQTSAGGDMEIRIMDSGGKIVKIIKEEAIGAGMSASWDGYDSNNKLVETGLYLYGVSLSGKTILTGTVVVAR